MTDGRGRKITYLRISLTDLCNFRCVYCMPPGGVEKIPHSEILRLEELLDVVRLLSSSFGINKVRVTGGEPLVRRGVTGFLEELCRIDSLRDVALTTNGSLLEEMAEEVWDAGVRRLNISLDSLRPDRFLAITRVDALDRVLRGVEAARRCGFSPIKMNIVAMRENLDEASDFVRYGIEKEIEVRFIERVPFGSDRAESFIPNRDVKEEIEKKYKLSLLDRPSETNAPVVRYRVEGGEGICGFISPVTEPFCAYCNRIRIRGDGHLLPCLKSTTQLDLRPWIRPEFRAEEMASAIRRFVGRGLKQLSFEDHKIRMSQIGG